MSETVERKLTIARGLARCKTIEAQLNQIENQIGQFGAWPDNKKHPLGNTKLDVKANHAEAEKEIKALFQSYHDLVNEFVKIKLAIQTANMVTQITIGDKTMSIAQAMVYRSGVARHMQNLNSRYAGAVMTANNEVQRNNNQVLGNANLDAEKQKVLLADINYLVPKAEIDRIGSAATVFLQEIDGELNAINAVTEIVID
jgi:hypothetical protein